jgi:hypothetical protein
MFETKLFLENKNATRDLNVYKQAFFTQLRNTYMDRQQQ